MKTAYRKMKLKISDQSGIFIQKFSVKKTIMKLKLLSHYLLIIVFTIFSANSQTLEEIRSIHDETPDDAYIQVDKGSMQRSPAYNVRTPNYFTSQVNVDANGNNIIGDAGNETSIAIDPTNPNRIVIGWRQFDTVNNNFRQAGYGYSLDGGLTWTFPDVLDPGNFRSDPVLDFDANGNFYYNSLRGTFECDVFKITDGGVEWEPFVPAFGGDKQWMTIDRSGGASAGHNYSYWNTSFTTCAPGAFTRSTDGSNSFEPCEVITDNPFWGTLTVDGNGDLYLVGRTNNDIVVVKSTNAKDPGQTVNWDFVTVVDLDGIVYAGAPVNPSGLVGQADIDHDNSGGQGDGNIYVLASVIRPGLNDPADVMFAKSTDGGLSFSSPVRINIDNGTNSFQWFGTMSVAPNGRIDVIYLDTSAAAAGTVDSRLIYTWSDDQGDTWNDYEIISEQFDPTIGYPSQNKMGDYFDMKSDNDFAHLAWCNTLNGGQDVYYTRISPEGILDVNDITAAENFGFMTLPNPFSEYTNLVFRSAVDQQAIIEVYDLQGRLLNTLFDGMASGNHEVRWNGDNREGKKVADGLYFVSLRLGGKRIVKKVILSH